MIRSCRRLALALTTGALVAGCASPHPDFRFLADNARRGDAASFERTIQTRSPVTLEIRTGNGSVRVRPGPAGVVRVRGTIANRPGAGRGLAADPAIRVSESRIIIGPGERPSRARGVSVNYDIEAPPDTIVRAQTGSGEQNISGFAGRVEARSGSGLVTLGRLRGSVAVETDSGRVFAEGIEGSLTGRTGSGSFEATGIVGALHVRTRSGGVQVEGEPHGRWDLGSGSGSIHVHVGPNAGFNLDARAGRGITNNHPIALLGRTERGRLQGQVRAGGTEVVLATGSGRIVLD